MDGTAAMRMLRLFCALVFHSHAAHALRLGLGAKMKAEAKADKVYDLVVVGGGSAGLEAAKFAAAFGKTSVIVEKAKLGGDCTWTGCVPSKTLLAAAKAAHAVKTAKEKWGVTNAPSEVAVDFGHVMRKVAEARSRIYDKDDSPEVMKAEGVDTLEGSATFVTPSTLSVALPDGSTTTIEAAGGVLIATGAGPVNPAIAGLDSVPHLTYEHVFNLESVPKALTVVGGGPVGCELAQAFSRLGSKVTLCAPKLLPTLDTEVGEALAGALRDEGVSIVAGRATAVEAGSGGGHVLTCGGERVSGNTLLVAAGRRPFTKGLGLESIGVELDGKTGGVVVDQQLRTSVQGVYAAGDCTGDVQYTHYAGFQGASGTHAKGSRTHLGLSKRRSVTCPAFESCCRPGSRVEQRRRTRCFRLCSRAWRPACQDAPSPRQRSHTSASQRPRRSRSSVRARCGSSG